MTIERETFNASSRLRESSVDGQLLSNLAHTSFWLDELFYESVEGFWKGLYYPEGSKERADLALLFGIEAKNSGKNKPKDITHITYQSELIKIGSDEHQDLMKRAIHAKVEQNPDVQAALLRTGNTLLTHVTRRRNGTFLPDSKSIPAHKFAKILMDEREILQREV